MAGQLISLPGVVAAASQSAPRIDMNTADIIAARIASLKHVVSARSLTELPAGGVSGRCRVTGETLIQKGVANALKLTEVAGKRALGLTTVLAAGLALPAGSQTSSYTAVAAVNVGQADIDSTAISTSPIFISGSDVADNMNLNVLQYFGAAGKPPNIFTARGVGTTSPFASVVRPGGSWVIAIVDFNNETRTVSLAVNQAATFESSVKSGSNTPAITDYLEIGNHGSQTSSLRSSKLGDLYTFSDSLLKTDLGKSQLTELVAALKTYYSIA